MAAPLSTSIFHKILRQPRQQSINFGLRKGIVSNGGGRGEDELVPTAKRSEVDEKSELGVEIGSRVSLDQVEGSSEFHHEVETLFGFEQVLQFLLVHHRQTELLQVCEHQPKLGMLQAQALLAEV